jgi:multiple sugar transport system substrate-binding protein
VFNFNSILALRQQSAKVALIEAMETRTSHLFFRARAAAVILLLVCLAAVSAWYYRQVHTSRRRVLVRMWAAPLMPDLIDRELYKNLQRKFMHEHPDIEVRVEFIPQQRRLQTMITASAGNRVPDAAAIALDYLPRFVKEDMLLPIDTLLPQWLRKDYDTDDLDAVRINGKLWGYPSWRAPVAALYNKDLFKKAGLNPEKPPATWDEVTSVAKALTRDTNGDGRIDQWGFGFGFGGETLNAGFWPILWQAGGEIFTPDEKQVAFNSAAGINALTWVVGLYQQHCIPPSYLNVSPNVGANDFAEGKVAYWWGANQTHPYKLRRDVPGLNIGYGPILSRERRVSFSSFGLNVIFAQCKHPKETGQWLAFLNRPDNLGYFCKALNVTPSSNAVPNLFTDDPVTAKFTEESKLCRPDVKNIFARDIMRILISQIQQAALGTKTPKEALDYAAERANELLARGK